MNHKQETVVIKTGKIDRGIARVVKWLNSYRSITTIYSCEGAAEDAGEDAAEDTDLPHVAFTAHDQLDLARVLDASGEFAVCDVMWSGSTLLYELNFFDCETLKQFTERLNGLK